MRPIIINVDYKHNPNKIYNISNKVTLKNKIVNIANKNIELNYKKEIIVGGQNSWELGGVEMEFLRII
nr:hypothetical protein [Providencia rettgeri]ELR5110789.1 hypothetical protein [Providencia rettgeri]